MTARSVFDWKGQPSKSGADLMRGMVPLNKKKGPLVTTSPHTTSINTERATIFRTKGAAI